MTRWLSWPMKLLFAILLFLTVFLIVRYSGYDPHQKELEWTRVSLLSYRQHIKSFHETNSRYPDSLLELSEYVRGKGARSERLDLKEHISTPTGCLEEHPVLDGTGGWYYDKETGTIKVNLTERLKVYFNRYFVLSKRNQIPSEW